MYEKPYYPSVITVKRSPTTLDMQFDNDKSNVDTYSQQMTNYYQNIVCHMSQQDSLNLLKDLFSKNKREVKIPYQSTSISYIRTSNKHVRQKNIVTYKITLQSKLQLGQVTKIIDKKAS